MVLSDVFGSAGGLMTLDYGEPFFVVDEGYRKALREPFPDDYIEQVPGSAGRPPADYINHAIVTDRLNKVAPDTTWTIDDQWEIVREEVHRKTGEVRTVREFWVRGTMNVGGVDRVEYGEGDDPKKAISDFVKRGAMRFGVAIDLWIRNDDAKQKSEPVEPVEDARPTGGSAEGHGMAGTDEARVLSSQIKALLRAATDLRWTDPDVARAVDEAYPGISRLEDLSQEQARALIPEWQSYARSVRMTDDQIDQVKKIVALSDAKKVAEQMTGFRVSSLRDLTRAEGDALIEKLKEVA